MAKMKSMKKLIFLALPILLFSNGSCENETESGANEPVPTHEDGGPYTTEDAIFKNLQKEYDGLEKNDVCIVEVEELGTLFVVGFFAHDRGCAVDRMYYNGEELSGDHSQAQKIMNGNDFKYNSEKLVELYHIDVINTFKSVVKTTNEDFEGHSTQFTEPKTYTKGDQVVSELWIQRPSGMVMENSYYLSTLTFDSKGNYVSLEKTKQFSVPY